MHTPTYKRLHPWMRLAQTYCISAKLSNMPGASILT